MYSDYDEEPVYFNERNSKDVYYKEQIINAVRNYVNASRKRPKKDKEIDSNDLVAFIIAHKQQLVLRNIDFVYSNHKFSKKCLDNMKSKEFKPLIESIIPILNGIIPDTHRLIYSDKLAFFSRTLCTPFFSIAVYFKRSTTNKDEAVQWLKFLDYTTNNESFDACCYEFIEDSLDNPTKSEKYPTIDHHNNNSIERDNEYVINNYHRFSCKHSRGFAHPITSLKIKDMNALYSAYVQGEKYEYANPFKYKTNLTTTHALDNVMNKPLHEYIINIVRHNNWNIIFSTRELLLINLDIPFVVSGQPGTGKTTVILVKLFAEYFNLQIEKSFVVQQRMDWEYIKNNIDKRNFNNQFKSVFISYSQDLCERAQSLFEFMLRKTEIINEIKYYPISKLKLHEIRSFDDVKSFPLFVNFRKLLFLIDSSMTFQFFKRDNFYKMPLPTNECEYTFQSNLKYICNIYNFVGYYYYSVERIEYAGTCELEEVNENEFYKFYTSLIKKTKNVKNNSEHNKEETIKTKNENFVYEHKDLLKSIKAEEVYSQICSVINDPLNVSVDDYVKCGKKFTQFSVEERKVVYAIAVLYAFHKKEHKYFDMQDFTEHLLKVVRREKNKGTFNYLVDYLYIDEIQDLSINQIELLTEIARCVKVYAGDSGQTISQTNRFRFKDLKQLFMKKANVKDALLNINYRLNNHILKLATFINHLTRSLFPDTLDQFKEDISVKLTPFKPLLLDSLDELKTIILNPKEQYENANLTFSCYSCWLFKNKATIDKVKEEFTVNNKCEIFPSDVFDSKGMEYEIVIIYNFFTDSKFRKIWENILTNISYEMTANDTIARYSREDIKKSLIKEDLSLIIEYIKKIYPEFFDSDDDGVSVKDKEKLVNEIINEHETFLFPRIKKSFNFDFHTNFAFCSELKQFYVMVSRPRTFLLFYEENQTECATIYNYFISKGLIYKEGQQLIKEQILAYFKNSKLQVANVEKITKIAEKEFKLKNYKKALFLYKKIGDNKNTIKSEVYALWEEFKEIKNEDEQNKKLKAQNILDIISTLEDNSFEDEDGIKGDCYKILGQNKKAAEEYEKSKLYDKCANIYYYTLRQYDKAYEFYIKCGNNYFAFECLEKLKRYKNAIELVNQIWNELSIIEYSERYKKYINQYFSVYISNLKSNKFSLFERGDVYYESKEEVKCINNINLIANVKSNNKQMSFQIKDLINTLVNDTSYDDSYLISPNGYWVNENTMKKNKSYKQAIFSFFEVYYTHICKYKEKIKYEKELLKKEDSDHIDPYDISYLDNLITPPLSQGILLDLLKELCPTNQVNNFIQTFYINDYQNIFKTIIENVPLLSSFRFRRFDLSVYINSLFNENKNDKLFKQLSEIISEEIKIIAHNAEINNKLVPHLIKECKAYHNLFLDNYYWYDSNAKFIFNCLLSNSKKVNLAYLKFVNEMENNNNVLTTNDIFLLSSYLRINSSKFIIKPYLYQNHFALISKELDYFFNQLRLYNVIEIDLENLFHSFIKQYNEILSNQNYYTYHNCSRILSLGTLISSVIFLSHVNKSSIDFKKDDIISTIRILQELSSFLNFILKTKMLSIQDILLLSSILNAYGLTYFSNNWSNIKELSLYNNINVFLLHTKSPIFYFKDLFYSFITQNHIIKCPFDFNGKALIIENDQAFNIFKYSILNISEYLLNELKPYIFHENSIIDINAKNNNINLINHFITLFYMKKILIDKYIVQIYLNFLDFVKQNCCSNIPNLFRNEFESQIKISHNKGNIVNKAFPFDMLLISLFFIDLNKEYSDALYIKNFTREMIGLLYKGVGLKTSDYNDIIKLISFAFDNTFDKDNNIEDKQEKYFEIIDILEMLFNKTPFMVVLFWLKKVSHFFIYFFTKEFGIENENANIINSDFISYSYDLIINEEFSYDFKTIIAYYKKYVSLLCNMVNLIYNNVEYDDDSWITNFISINLYCIYISYIKLSYLINKPNLQILNEFVICFDFLALFEEKGEIYFNKIENKFMKPSTSLSYFKDNIWNNDNLNNNNPLNKKEYKMFFSKFDFSYANSMKQSLSFYHLKYTKYKRTKASKFHKKLYYNFYDEYDNINYYNGLWKPISEEIKSSKVYYFLFNKFESLHEYYKTFIDIKETCNIVNEHYEKIKNPSICSFEVDKELTKRFWKELKSEEKNYCDFVYDEELHDYKIESSDTELSDAPIYPGITSGKYKDLFYSFEEKEEKIQYKKEKRIKYNQIMSQNIPKKEKRQLDDELYSFSSDEN